MKRVESCKIVFLVGTSYEFTCSHTFAVQCTASQTDEQPDVRTDRQTTLSCQ